MEWNEHEDGEGGAKNEVEKEEIIVEVKEEEVVV